MTKTPHTILDQRTGKKISFQMAEKLKPFMKSEKDTNALGDMNRKQRREFYAKNKHLLKK